MKSGAPLLGLAKYIYYKTRKRLHNQITVESFMRGHSLDTKKVSITRAVLTLGY